MNLPQTTHEPAGGFDPFAWFANEVWPHEPALRNWLRVRFPAIGDQDDLVQETFFRVWRARGSGPIISVKAFLFATARNLAVDILNHRRFEIELGESTISFLSDEQSDPAEAAARGQELELLNKALESLPDRCRRVFTLRRIHGVPQKEIAARLGISEKTVEAQISIAMHKCVRFFEQSLAPAARSAPVASPFVPVASSPQHA